MAISTLIGVGLGIYAWQGIPAGEVPLSAASAILMDAETGLVLLEKAPDVQRHPASTTKMMTAILIQEGSNLTDIVTAPADITKIKESSAHLKPGEKLSMNDLLHAIMLRSANDACVAGAIHIAGSVPKFAERMTARAKELGCEHTNFTNPHGLTGETHLTTARDLAIIGRKYMEYPVLREIAKTQKFTLTRSINQKDTLIESRNHLLGVDPTIDGIKTGWTIPAGKCFVGSATRNGRQFISVVMKTEAWQHDTLNLLNWGFANYVPNGLLSQSQSVASKEIEGAETPLVARSAENVAGIAGQKLQQSITWNELKLPIAAGAEVGTLTLTDGRQYSKTVKLVAASEVRTKTGPLIAGILAGLLGVGAGILFFRYRRHGSHGTNPPSTLRERIDGTSA